MAPLLTVAEAARLLQTSEAVVRALAEADRIPAVDVSLPGSRRRRWRFDHDALVGAASGRALRGTQEVTIPVRPATAGLAPPRGAAGVLSGSVYRSGVPDPPWLRRPQ